VIKAFLYLSSRSLKNRLLAQIRRLRRPKYLLFASIGVGYFYMVAGRHWMRGMHFAGQVDRHAPPMILIEIAGALFVLGCIVVAWCSPSPVSALTFTEAEIHYLFPAPVARRSLVKWKLLRGQLGVLISVLIFTAVSGPYLAGGSRLLFMAGAWVAFATMQFLLTGIRMARHRLQLRGIGWLTRTAVTLGALIAVVGFCFWWAAGHVGPPDFERLTRMEGEGGFQNYVARLFDAGPVWGATIPARLLLRPALAGGLTSFLLSLPLALSMLLASYLWVVRSGVVLEEGALVAARRMEESKRSFTQGRMGRARRIRATPAPFRLAPIGRPEVALVWKNLISVLRNAGGMQTFFWIVAACMIPSVVVTILQGRGMERVAQVLGMLCAMFAAILLVVGPSMVRSEFRRDLVQIDLLKSFPIRGRSILLGTLLAPVLMLTLIEWGLLGGFAFLAVSPTEGPAVLRLAPPSLALTGALLALPMNLVAALIHNAALLLVPGWVTFGATRTTGVERMGQGMVTTLGFLLVMVVVFVPAALVFGLTWFFVSAFIGNVAAIPLSALPAMLVLASEAWMGIALLGAYLDRFDPSREFDSLSIN